MSDHGEHDSSKYPVEGCNECDEEIKRPIVLKHGKGSSDVVIPRREMSK